jgi:hypothetical protein
MQFAPKHVVAMVCAVSAAVVLAPVGVMAATGTLTNITDPLDSSRKARVSAMSGLYVETRPRATAGAFSAATPSDLVGVTRQKLYETTAPNRIAVTDIMATVRDNGSGTTLQNDLALLAYVQGPGASATCGGSGWVPTTLRFMTVFRGRTEQFTFDGTPLLTPPAPDGRKVCLMAYQSRWWDNTSAKMAIGGFVFK